METNSYTVKNRAFAQSICLNLHQSLSEKKIIINKIWKGPINPMAVIDEISEDVWHVFRRPEFQVQSSFSEKY